MGIKFFILLAIFFCSCHNRQKSKQAYTSSNDSCNTSVGPFCRIDSGLFYRKFVDNKLTLKQKLVLPFSDWRHIINERPVDLRKMFVSDSLNLLLGRQGEYFISERKIGTWKIGDFYSSLILTPSIVDSCKPGMLNGIFTFCKSNDSTLVLEHDWGRETYKCIWEFTYSLYN